MQDANDFQEILKTITTKASGSSENNYVNALDTLHAYSKSKKNVIYERFQFNQAKQAPNKTAGQYAVCLRDLALTCDYDNIDQQICDHIIQTCCNKELRLKALRQAMEAEITLETVLKLGKDLEQIKNPSSRREFTKTGYSSSSCFSLFVTYSETAWSATTSDGQAFTLCKTSNNCY